MNHVAARTLVMASLAALCTGAYAAETPPSAAYAPVQRAASEAMTSVRAAT